MVGLTVLIGCMGQLHCLIRAAEVSAQPATIASGTRPLQVCRVRAAHGFPPHARRSFFERVHGLGILFISLGPGAHMREAQVLEGAIDRIVRHESRVPTDREAKLSPPRARFARPRSLCRAVSPTNENGAAYYDVQPRVGDRGAPDR